jgi:hypothetical protein
MANRKNNSTNAWRIMIALIAVIIIISMVLAAFR